MHVPTEGTLAELERAIEAGPETGGIDVLIDAAAARFHEASGKHVDRPVEGVVEIVGRNADVALRAGEGRGDEQGRGGEQLRGAALVVQQVGPETDAFGERIAPLGVDRAALLRGEEIVRGREVVAVGPRVEQAEVFGRGARSPCDQGASEAQLPRQGVG